MHGHDTAAFNMLHGPRFTGTTLKRRSRWKYAAANDDDNMARWRMPAARIVIAVNARKPLEWSWPHDPANRGVDPNQLSHYV